MGPASRPTRAAILGDTGESSPENWEKPLGSADVHVVLTALAPDTERLEAFEFVQSEWMNDASFFGGGDAKDPVAGEQRRRCL